MLPLPFAQCLGLYKALAPTLSPLILALIHQGMCYCSHITDGKTNAQRIQVMMLKGSQRAENETRTSLKDVLCKCKPLSQSDDLKNSISFSFHTTIFSPNCLFKFHNVFTRDNM